MNSIKPFLILNFGLFGFLFFHLAKQMLQVRPEGLFVGQVNLYGDLVLHLSFINKFLYSDKILIESPIYANSKPNYPFFADFITAQVAKLTSIDFALFLTTFLAGILVIFVARLFILNFIKNDKVVFLTFLLFFVNGGFGFFYFFQDYLASDKSIFDFLTNLPREYTDIKENGYWWINTYLAYFLPQRGFLLAFPITLLTLILLYLGSVKAKTKYFLLAGLMAGTLPLVQAHSLFVIFLLSLFYCVTAIAISKDKKKTIGNWLTFAATTALIAFPIFKSISQTTNPFDYFRFDPGWTSEENIIWFWFKNLGLFGPVLLVSLFWLFKKSRHLFSLYLPFLAIFFLSNIFIFQPWNFDNSKLLVYWYFASTIVVAYFLHESFFAENKLRRSIATVLVFLMIIAGSLDLFRTFTPITNYQIFSQTDLQIAESVKNLTPKDTVFVTAANHNHPIPALTGRSTLLGFHGWVWSHGLPYQGRASDIAKIYQGDPEARPLLSQYRVSYITIGPQERANFNINEGYFAQFPKIYLASGWDIYDVSNLWSDSNRQD